MNELDQVENVYLRQSRARVQRRGHGPRPRARGRGRQAANPDLPGRGDRPPRRRHPRDLHGAQDVRQRSASSGSSRCTRRTSTRSRSCAGARCAAPSCTTCGICAARRLASTSAAKSAGPERRPPRASRPARPEAAEKGVAVTRAAKRGPAGPGDDRAVRRGLSPPSAARAGGGAGAVRLRPDRRGGRGGPRLARRSRWWRPR